MRNLFPAFALFILLSPLANAQVDVAFPSQSVNYKIVQDDPKDLNHLWIKVQPLTVDLMQMNAAVGSGLEVTYLPKPGLQIDGGIRGNLINAFDIQRTAAKNNASITTQASKREQNEMVVTNLFSRFFAFEVGAMYAFKDENKDGASKIVLGDNAVPGNTAFPEVIEVNAKSREIWNARLGVSSLTTTVSLQNAIEKQEVTVEGSNGTKLTKEGSTSANGFKTSSNTNEPFSNFSATGFYAGAAFQKIKNISIKTDRQGIVSNNSILTLYADVMFAPWTTLEDMHARMVGQSTEETFNVSPIKINRLGGRIGAEVRYNQASFVAVGAEIGYRPSIQGEGMYAVVKLSIPAFSFGATKSKISTNVGQNQSLTQ